MKKNNLNNTLRIHKRKLLITLLGIFGIFLTVSVVKNSESIIDTIYYGNSKSSDTTNPTPQKLQWFDSFEGVNNMKEK